VFARSALVPSTILLGVASWAWFPECIDFHSIAGKARSQGLPHAASSILVAIFEEIGLD